MDTPPGGRAAGFPATRISAIVATRSEDPEIRTRAFEALIASYWKPTYKYIRIKWKAEREDAEDLTQGFFTRALEKGFFQRYDPAKARFRTYLRTCLDGYVANERRAAGRIKRACDRKTVSLDFETAEGELRQRELPDPTDLDDYFHKEWVRSIFALAVETLRERCHAAGKTDHFTLFERYDLEGPDSPSRVTYQDLARELGLPVTQVTNYLAFARREFRAIVLERLREATGSEEEFRAEAHRILGGDGAR